MNKLVNFVKILMNVGTIGLIALTTLVVAVSSYNILLSPSFCENSGKYDCPPASIAFPFSLLMAVILFEIIIKLKDNVFKIGDFRTHIKSSVLAFLVLVMWFVLGFIELYGTSFAIPYQMAITGITMLIIVMYFVLKLQNSGFINTENLEKFTHKMEQAGNYSLLGILFAEVAMILSELIIVANELSNMRFLDYPGYDKWIWLTGYPTIFYSFVYIQFLSSFVSLYYIAHYYKRRISLALIIGLIPLIIGSYGFYFNIQ